MECDDFGAFSDIDSDEDEKVVAEFKHGKYFKWWSVGQLN